MSVISESWDKILATQYELPYVMGIQARIKQDAGVICPSGADIFNAFKLTPFEDVRVVIVGQAPYHDGSADGLAFSSREGYPPALRVILKEVRENTTRMKESPDLSSWAKEGVLLLNTVLTTTRGSALAHNDIGWQKFTGYALMRLALNKKPKVFMLWGKEAKAMGDKYIAPYNKGHHYILTAVHPAVDAYGGKEFSFAGCGHFRKANDFLGEEGRGRIKWT